MNSRYRVSFIVVLLAASVLATNALAGGWAIITLRDFPEYVIAGKPVELTFAVRQHGKTLLDGLHPTVRATSTGGLVITANAKPAGKSGEYTAVVPFTQPGEWSITIASGFNNNSTTLPVLKVIASSSPLPTAFSPATKGVRLFQTKGCIGCHRHVEVNPERATEARFDLTGKRFPQEYLKKFLSDPSIKPAEMPNLALKTDEIDALAAFINKTSVKQATRGGRQ